MSTTSNTATAGEPDRLQRFPVSFFAVIMGLAGLTIAWRKAEVVFTPPFAVSCLLEQVTVIVFVLLGVVYLSKALLYPREVAKELDHPVKLNFFPTISIGLLLLAIALMEGNPAASRWLWLAGAALHFAFTLYVMNAWIHHTRLEVAHVNPAWFIPLVGNILVPIAGVKFYSPEISWFFFSVGLIFWIVLLTIVMYRLFFHAPLPERLMPTLFILIAPPAVGFIAYVSLMGAVDAFARILYYTALLLTALMASNALRFLKAKFFLSAWAYTFPLAAMAVASLIMTREIGGAAFGWLSKGLLGVVTLVVAALSVRTLVAVARREICVEEAG